MKKQIIALVALSIIALIVIIIAIAQNPKQELSYEDAKTTLNALLSKVSIKENKDVKPDRC